MIKRNWRYGAVLMLEALAALAAGIAISGGILIAFYPFPAAPHEATNTAGQPLGWKYPWSCCATTDCGPIDQSRVHEGPDGYSIDGSSDDGPIAYGESRIKDSPDGTYHWCVHQTGTNAGKTICLFVPTKGF